MKEMVADDILCLGNLAREQPALKVSVFPDRLHDDQDEVFFVTHGRLVVELRTGDVEAVAGDLLVIPRGVEHRPRADEEVRFLIVGTSVTSNAAGGKPAWSVGGGLHGAS